MSERRVYLEYVLSADSQKSLIALQSSLQQPGDTVVPASQLHLTLLHIGKFDQFLADLRRGNPTLSATVLDAALNQFLAATELILPATATFRPSAIVPFGASQQLLVLIGSIEPEVMRAHAACLDELHTLLQSCGINHPVGFMRTSMNLRHALTFSPHISLLRQATPEPLELQNNSFVVLQLELADPELDLRPQLS